MEAICGVISHSGPNGEPLACGYLPEHEGNHSWATIPTFTKDEPIFEAIRRERNYQEQRWGGAEHDDGHNTHDWIAFIVKHTGKAVTWPFEIKTYRRQMVRVAALAVASIASLDRNFTGTK